MYIEYATWVKELRPFDECPVWARLQLIDKIPKTYFWDADMTNPRQVSEIEVQGFERVDEELIYIGFIMPWIAGINAIVKYGYHMPIHKYGS